MVNKTVKMQFIEVLLDRELKHFLNNRYHKKKHNLQKICNEIKEKTDIDVAPMTLTRWFRQFSIKVRNSNFNKGDKNE